MEKFKSLELEARNEQLPNLFAAMAASTRATSYPDQKVNDLTWVDILVFQIWLQIYLVLFLFLIIYCMCLTPYVL